MNCKKCNSVINETDKFCKVCGTMVDNISNEMNGSNIKLEFKWEHK